jgi:hypothetical protein
MTYHQIFHISNTTGAPRGAGIAYTTMQWSKEKKTNNAMVKRKRNEKTIVDIILHEALKMEHNEPTIIRGYLIWGVNFRYSNCIANYKTFMTDHIGNISIVWTHTTRLPPTL